MTRQRTLIGQIIRQNCGRHLTADEIYAQARQEMPALARGTVYRNLKLMEQAGEVVRLELPDGPDRYDAALTPHAHLYCDRCGCLQDVALPDLTAQLEAGIGAPVHRYLLLVHTLCPACRSRQAPC